MKESENTDKNKVEWEIDLERKVLIRKLNKGEIDYFKRALKESE